MPYLFFFPQIGAIMGKLSSILLIEDGKRSSGNMKGRSASSNGGSSSGANVISALEKALLEEVKTSGKPLGAKEIQAVVRSFKSKPGHSAAQGAAPSVGFTQLLIAPFVDVIDEANEVSREAIPRAVVPAFEAAMDMLCGEDTVFKCRGRCKSLTTHLEGQSYSPSELKEKVMNDTTGFKVLTYLLAKVVMKFDDFESRREWMIRFVNEHLHEATDLPRLSRRDDVWKFGEDSFNKLFRAILVNPKTDTQNELMEKVYEIVWNQYDTKGIKVATQFLRALGADHSHKTA